MQRAARKLLRRKELENLLAHSARKAEQHYEALLSCWESLQTFMRLVRAWMAGQYVPRAATLVMVVGAIVYFWAPFDLIPDSIPVFGLMDDAAVISFVARENLSEISRFRQWESAQERKLARLA